MENRKEKALELFRNKYNCAQSILVAYADVVGLTEETALKLTSGFGGGVAGIAAALAARRSGARVLMIEKGTISNNIAKKLLIPLLEEGGSAEEMVQKQGLSVISNEDELKSIIDSIITANQGQVTAYKNGKTQLFGFFVGQVMKQTQGRANPQTVNSLLKEALDK